MATELTEKEIVILDAKTIKSKIYIIRGQQVMLDFELAEIYGYSTNRFNQQVKRNKEKFEGFLFKLTKEEISKILISQNVTSSWGGNRNLPSL